MRTVKTRWPLCALLIVALLWTHAALAALPFKDGERVLFLGDSITQAGQYVAFIETYLWAKYPARDIDIINLGLSSETASGQSEKDHPGRRPCIHDRLDKCLATADADWVVVCYGMNDGIYHPPGAERLAAYKEGITKLVKKVQAVGAKVILMTPPPFDVKTRRLRGAKVQPAGADLYGYKTPYEDYDQVLAGYGDWIMTQRDKVAHVIDLHTPMSAYIAACRDANPEYTYGDSVHPPRSGHYRMALAFLEALGEDGDKARQLLTRITGQPLYPGESGVLVDASPRLLEALMQRSADVSASYRGHVTPAKRRANTLPLDEALALAKTREAALRPEVVNRGGTLSVPKIGTVPSAVRNE